MVGKVKEKKKGEKISFFSSICALVVVSFYVSTIDLSVVSVAGSAFLSLSSSLSVTPRLYSLLEFVNK